MSDLNVASLIGRVGKDPDLRYLPSGDPVASFSLATSEKWRSKSGEMQEKTQWHRIEVFGKLAQTVKDYVTKGKQIYVEGQITYDEWTDKDGNQRNTTKIKVAGFGSRLILLGNGNGKSKNSGSRPAPPPVEGDDNVADDDVPF